MGGGEVHLRPWRDAPLLMPRLGRRVEVRRPHPVHPARNNTEGYSVQTGRATDTTAASGESGRETENRKRRQNVLLLLHASPCPAQLGWLFRTIPSHRPKPALRQRCRLPAIARSPSHATATSSHDPIPEQTTPRLDRGRPWMVAQPTYYTLCYLAIPQSQPVASPRDLDTAVRRVSGTHRSPPLDRGSVSWTEATSDDDHLHQLHLSLR